MHLNRLEATLAESSMLLQKEGGLDGELKTSGAICERFVTDTLSKFIVPDHFRVTSGFVATPRLLREGHNLPQCDVLIVDRGVQPLLRFDESGIEVVPREGVCGIIEVKRSLTTQSLTGRPGVSAGALQHLASIVNTFDDAKELKSDRTLKLFNRHVGFHNHSSNKPLLGIVALKNDLPDFGTEVEKAIESSKSLVDFVWTLDGFALLPAFDNGQNLLYYTHTARPVTRSWASIEPVEFAEADSPFYHIFPGKPGWAPLQPAPGESDRARVFSIVLGVVSLMLSRTSARPLQEDDVNDYYLRH